MDSRGFLQGAHSVEAPRSPPEAADSIYCGAGGTKVPTSLVGPTSQPPIPSEHDCLRARTHADLVEDGREMVADRLLADEEFRGNVGVVRAAGDQIEDFALARGQRFQFLTCRGHVRRAAPRLRLLPS